MRRLARPGALVYLVVGDAGGQADATMGSAGVTALGEDDEQGFALALAHPGHELRLTEWVRRVRPEIFILTQGSRSGPQSVRTEASRALAHELGARPGPIFGAFPDREVYHWIMRSDAAPFLRLADTLADHFVARRTRTVVADAWQFYNVAHDLWRLTARRAAALAARRLGQPVRFLDYAVVPESMAGRRLGPRRHDQPLTADAVQRKIRMAEAYPEIADDFASVLAAGGPAFIADESLHDPRPLAELLPRPGETPQYETVGEARVAAGLYREPLRWSHVEPIAHALGQAVGEGCVAA